MIWDFNTSRCIVKIYADSESSRLKPLFSLVCLLLTTQCIARLDGGSSLTVKYSVIIQFAMLQNNVLNLDINV
jgi:hypothetical protein